MALFLKTYWKLVEFDFCLAHGDFKVLYSKVRRCPVRNMAPLPNAIERVCSAVNLACIWYWKEALCLQRSAATTCVLRQQGIRAEMVIGAQQMPFRAHAWVEVDGHVVNDNSYTPEMYSVMDRC